MKRLFPILLLAVLLTNVVSCNDNSCYDNGSSLPFFSYGGTALAILLGEMGIILSVSRQTTVEKE